MTVRLAINGFGRTGRTFLRAALSSSHDLEIVAINDLGPPEALARLFARDSVHGRYREPVSVDGDTMVIGTRRIAMLAEPQAKGLPWRDLGVDVVIESTGKYTSREKAAAGTEESRLAEPALPRPSIDRRYRARVGRRGREDRPDPTWALLPPGATRRRLDPFLLVPWSDGHLRRSLSR